MKGAKPRSSPEGTATDAEIAWRLHQELNAISPMLRTRARKAATSTKASDAETAKDEQTTDGEDPTPQPSTAAAESPKKASAEQPPAKKEKANVAVEQFKREVRTRTEKPASAVVEKRKLPQDEDRAAAQSKKKDRKQQPVEESTAPNLIPGPTKHRSRKGRPEPAATAGEQRVAGSSKTKPPAKPPKIPKLPMVRQGKRWYRARLMKETDEKALIEFAGFEAVLPTVWLPKVSHRIWFGSYKGKDWRYLGEGAWEPKNGVHNRIFNGARSEEEEEEEERPHRAETKKTSKDIPKNESKQQQQPPAAPLEDPEDEFIVVDEPIVTRPDRSRHHQQQQREKRPAGDYGGSRDKSSKLPANKKPRKVSHRGSDIDTRVDSGRHGIDLDNDGNEQQQPRSHQKDDEDEALALVVASKKLPRKPAAVAKQLGEGNGTTVGGSDGRRRRGRPPGSVHTRSLAENKSGYGMNTTTSSPDQQDEDEEEQPLPRRPRRSARRAPIYNDDEFALHDDIDIEIGGEDENPSDHFHGVASGRGGLTVAEAAAAAAEAAAETARLQQQRKRRKPLVSSPAPTDVSPLDVGPEEYQALAALASMPSPMEDTYYDDEEEEVDIGPSVLPSSHPPQHRHQYHQTQHQQHRYGESNGRDGGGRRSSYVPPEPTKLMQRQHRKFEDYHGSGSGGVSGITSIAMAEQMFGQLLGAISCRFGGTTNTPTAVNTTPRKTYNELDMKFSSDTWTSFSHMPAIINVNAELLKAALPLNSSDDGSGSPDTGDEGGGGGRKPVVPLFC